MKPAWLTAELNSNQPAQFGELFFVTKDASLQDIEKALTSVFTKLTSFDTDFKREEHELKQLKHLYNPFRKDRHKLLQGDAYLLQMNVERIIGWANDLIFQQ